MLTHIVVSIYITHGKVKLNNILKLNKVLAKQRKYENKFNSIKSMNVF